MAELNLKLIHSEENLQNQIIDIFERHIAILNKTGSVTTGESRIRLRCDKVVNYRPYSLAPCERDKVKLIIQDLIDNDIIRKSESPFASPVM